MKRYKDLRVLARFRPLATDDLDPVLLSLVGAEAEFSYRELLDDDDTPYTGQWVLTTEDRRFGGYWFPECDLEVLQEKHTA
ncbi:MAG: hypothetical protein WBO06_12920 [Gammaproteobacteria bacterium]